MRRIWLMALAALLCLAAAVTLTVRPAEATVIDGSPTFQRWADESLMPTPSGHVQVIFDSPQGAWVEGKRTIHWYVQTEEEIQAWDLARPLFLHELGHVDQDQAQQLMELFSE